MGLFGRKKKPDGIRAIFYEGDLNGFSYNSPCQILLMDEALRITKINPDVEVKLDRRRISSIDIYSEIEYMKRFKGTSGESNKKNAIKKTYLVVNYVSKEGESKQLTFWGASAESLKFWNLKKEIAKDELPGSYEI